MGALGDNEYMFTSWSSQLCTALISSRALSRWGAQAAAGGLPAHANKAQLVLGGRRIVKVACGVSTSYALSKNGKVCLIIRSLLCRHIYTRTHIHSHTNTHSRTRTNTHTHKHTSPKTERCGSGPTRTPTHTQTHTHTHTHTRTHTHTHTRTHTHTHTHTPTHTRTHKRCGSGPTRTHALCGK